MARRSDPRLGRDARCGHRRGRSNAAHLDSSTAHNYCSSRSSSPVPRCCCKGLTLPTLIRAVNIPGDNPDADRTEYGRLLGELSGAAEIVLDDPELDIQPDGNRYPAGVIDRVYDDLRIRIRPPAGTEHLPVDPREQSSSFACARSRLNARSCSDPAPPAATTPAYSGALSAPWTSTRPDYGGSGSSRTTGKTRSSPAQSDHSQPTASARSAHLRPLRSGQCCRPTGLDCRPGMRAHDLDILRSIVDERGGFGHQEHLELTWRYLRLYEPTEAQRAVGSAIRHVASSHGAPDKHHETITRCWVHLVALHRAQSDTESFDEFIAENRGLLDRDPLDAHYSAELISSPRARTQWAEPDLRDLPQTA